MCRTVGANKLNDESLGVCEVTEITKNIKYFNRNLIKVLLK